MILDYHEIRRLNINSVFVDVVLGVAVVVS